MTKDEALKLALDLATMHHTDDGYAELRAQVRSATKEALAQPEQEPVAWRYLTRYPTQNVWTYCGSEPETKPEREALYTSPPQRTWVRLTDEEIMDMYNEPRSDAEMIAFGREVEAKLKEKNT